MVDGGAARGSHGTSLPKRQRITLALLDALGGSVPRLDFQKLLFLYCQELDGSAPYEFVPYRYGAFSFTSYADRRRLIAHGLLADAPDWRLTSEGRGIAHRERDMHVSTFARCNRLRGDALVAASYRRFPYYAIRSEMATHLLRDDQATSRRVDAARPRTIPGSLFTIGYQRRTLDGYLNVLIRRGVTLLCDVRRNPISRKYGFSKSTLSSSCLGVGIRYEHLPDLGISSSHRRRLRTQSDYDGLFAAYRRQSLPAQGAELARIARWLRSGESVALTCFERLPEQCHRYCVADALTLNAQTRFGVTHL